MPDLDLIIQGEQEARDRRGWCEGQVNPAGRSRGCRDHANRAARLLLAGEAEALGPQRPSNSYRRSAVRVTVSNASIANLLPRARRIFNLTTKSCY